MDDRHTVSATRPPGSRRSVRRNAGSRVRNEPARQPRRHRRPGLNAHRPPRFEGDSLHGGRVAAPSDRKDRQPRRRFDRLRRIMAGVAWLGVCGIGWWAVTAYTHRPSSYDMPSHSASAPTAPDAASDKDVQHAATGGQTAIFPELQGLRCGQAKERLRLLGFDLVVLVSVDAKLASVSAPNDWSVTKEGASPHNTGATVPLGALITVRCQWDGAGLESRSAKPRTFKITPQ